MRAAQSPAMERGPLTTIAGARPLYARIMGDTWFLLAEPVRALHTTHATTRARGFLRIEHGGHQLARVIVRAFRLPPASAATRTELAVIAHEDGERWERTFGGTRVGTCQSSDGSALVERYGALEFRFHLHESAGRLVYLQREAAVRIGPLRLRLPGHLAPHVEASEHAVAPARVSVSVRITILGVGLLIAYDGVVDIAEACA